METEKERTVPVCNILGVKIAAVSRKWFLCYITEHLTELSGKYICVSNVHTTVMSCEEKDYRAIQNGAAFAVPDGAPLAFLCRKRGFLESERITGPDLMEEIFKISEAKGYRHYFYGSTRETLDRLKDNLKKKYPGIKIAGMESPPFRELTKEEEKSASERILEANPDFLWVGLGAPKQERWMAEHREKLNGVMIGVGAGFDYHAGNIKRAPAWMQKMCLEWLYRLFQDPKRLFKRYLVTNSKFLWYLLKESREKPLLKRDFSFHK